MNKIVILSNNFLVVRDTVKEGDIIKEPYNFMNVGGDNANDNCKEDNDRGNITKISRHMLSRLRTNN